MHRDIKLQNILMHKGVPKLADFGIIKDLNNTLVSKSKIGTECNNAPEYFDG